MRIHTYAAAEAGLLVNSYLLETDHGVVAIDTNLLNSDIAALSGAPTLTAEAQVALERAMQQFLPNAPLTWMIGLGAEAVATEIARERVEYA